MQTSQEQLLAKNQELADISREKSKKLSQMTNLYNILKAKAMRSRMETAASEDVTQALKTLNTLSTNEAIGPARLPSLSLPGANHQVQMVPMNMPINKDGVEQLHRYQRSGTGSSRHMSKTPSAPSRMAPPSRPRQSLQNGEWLYTSY